MRKKILIVEDDADIRKLIRANLTPADFDVYEAENGQEGWTLAQHIEPDLIILDIMMPLMDGHTVCRLLRNNTRTAHIPIIMLTAKTALQDKLDGFTTGATDYVTKPFNMLEILARIRAQLAQSQKAIELNPLTELPGNLTIQRKIQDAIKSSNPFAVVYADLDYFKAYNDYYGFLKGDEVLLFVAQILKDAKDCWGNQKDFLGHIGGDDFVLMTAPEKADALCEGIIDLYEKGIQDFYGEKEWAKKGIETYDRQGVLLHFPIASLSLAVVTNEKRKFSTHLEVAEIAAEVKKKVKQMPGSAYYKDRRTDEPESDVPAQDALPGDGARSVDADEELLPVAAQTTKDMPATIAAPKIKAVETAKKRVLVVDDEPDIITIIKTNLEQKYDVLCVHNGEEAIEKMESFKPDIVVLDVMLPGMDGWELCRKIRKHEDAFTRTKIIMLTARTQSTDVKKSFDAGCDDYVVKPFEPAEFEKRIEQLLDGSWG